jgi:hypothetical protein
MVFTRNSKPTDQGEGSGSSIPSAPVGGGAPEEQEQVPPESQEPQQPPPTEEGDTGDPSGDGNEAPPGSSGGGAPAVVTAPTASDSFHAAALELKRQEIVLQEKKVEFAKLHMQALEANAAAATLTTQGGVVIPTLAGSAQPSLVGLSIPGGEVLNTGQADNSAALPQVILGPPAFTGNTAEHLPVNTRYILQQKSPSPQKKYPFFKVDTFEEAIDYVFAVETIKSDEQGVSDKKVIQALLDNSDETGKMWFREMRETYSTWEEIKHRLLTEKGGEKYKKEFQKKMEAYRQHVKMSWRDFTNHIYFRMKCIVPEMPDMELFDLIKANGHPRTAQGVVGYTNKREFVDFGMKIEDFRKHIKAHEAWSNQAAPSRSLAYMQEESTPRALLPTPHPLQKLPEVRTQPCAEPLQAGKYQLEHCVPSIIHQPYHTPMPPYTYQQFPPYPPLPPFQQPFNGQPYSVPMQQPEQHPASNNAKYNNTRKNKHKSKGNKKPYPSRDCADCIRENNDPKRCPGTCYNCKCHGHRTGACPNKRPPRFQNRTHENLN